MSQSWRVCIQRYTRAFFCDFNFNEHYKTTRARVSSITNNNSFNICNGMSGCLKEYTVWLVKIYKLSKSIRVMTGKGVP